MIVRVMLRATLLGGELAAARVERRAMAPRQSGRLGHCGLDQRVDVSHLDDQFRMRLPKSMRDAKVSTVEQQPVYELAQSVKEPCLRLG